MVISHHFGLGCGTHVLEQTSKKGYRARYHLCIRSPASSERCGIQFTLLLSERRMQARGGSRVVLNGVEVGEYES